MTTDTADVKMTEKALEEDTAAFEDTTQDCLVCQTKVADEAYNKSLSEELEVLAKTKDVISEKTGDSEYRDNVIERRFGTTIPRKSVNTASPLKKKKNLPKKQPPSKKTQKKHKKKKKIPGHRWDSPSWGALDPMFLSQ